MRKPVVDYRKFELSKLNSPKFSHLKYLFGWIGYFALYFLTETLIPLSKCHVMHSPVDDWIPFHEAFVIPYVFWYFLIVGTLVYLALYNPKGFKYFMTFIIVTQVVAMTWYILRPSCQMLRPKEFPRDNFLSKCVAFLYAFDDNTGVCPSLHVAYSIGIASAWLKEKHVHVLWKIFVIFAVIMICLSTMFIKQHSFVDVYAALPVCVLAEIIAYYRPYWYPKHQKKKLLRQAR